MMSKKKIQIIALILLICSMMFSVGGLVGLFVVKNIILKILCFIVCNAISSTLIKTEEGFIREGKKIYGEDLD